MTGVSSTSDDRPEWTPPYLHQARTAAGQAMTGAAASDSERVALAVRELAAEVRALRHQLAGGGDPLERGALGEIDASIDFGSRRRG